ncbi:MAG: hypothetical protein IKK45_02850 [Akkermansia sp.]|nr:hypothetical protein [Akkermansia sp.]
MAIHIQMSEEAENALKRDALRNKLSSIGAALGLTLGGAAILFTSVILIAVEPEAEFIGYTPPAENLPPRPNPTVTQLTAKSSPPSTAVAPSVIVSAGAAPVAMAQVDIPMDDTMDDGMSLDIGLSMDAGLGDSLGDTGGGMGSAQQGGSNLTGTFYDMKLTRAKSRSKAANKDGGANTDEIVKILQAFTRNWDPSVLGRYFSPSQKLNSPFFYVPVVMASYPPKAFKCPPEVKPAGWAALYKGKVKAPKSGTFRFVGVGDDFLAVRFNRETVLEAGYIIPSLYDPKKPNNYHISKFGANRGYRQEVKDGKYRPHKGYEFIQYPNIKIWNDEIAGLTAGKTFTVKEGQEYQIEILISEIPGGKFGFVLLIEDVKDNPVVKNGKVIPGRKFDIFRTNFAIPNQEELKQMTKGFLPGGEMQWPAFEEDSPIWVAVP